MKQNLSKNRPSFIARNKDILVISSVIVVLSGVAVTYYYMNKKKNKKEDSANSDSTSTTSTTTSTLVTRKPSTKKGYSIKYGSRHPDVKILQRYLKIYKEDLGRTGIKRDGVDGVFGIKTSNAAKRRLGKTVFTQADIAGMQKTLKSLGK